MSGHRVRDRDFGILGGFFRVFGNGNGFGEHGVLGLGLDWVGDEITNHILLHGNWY